MAEFHTPKPLLICVKIMDAGEHKISWNSQLERILSDEGERALCFTWLHSKSEKYYSRLSTYINLPVIMLSTIAGAGSIGSSTLFNNSQAANIVIGTISLGVATLNTVESYFGWAKRSEAHRMSGTAYGKVYRFIQIELALPRSERIAAKDMLKIVREQCDRLQETSPQIPDVIIGEFKAKFSSNTEVTKPEITNGLHPIHVHPPDMESPKIHHRIREAIEEELKDHTKISIDDHTRGRSQRSSSVHPLSESASDSNHT
jgi:hypothetical protein